MSIGLGQIIIILIIIVLLFGNLPKILKDLALGIKSAKEIINSDKNKKDSTDNDNNSQEQITKK